MDRTEYLDEDQIYPTDEALELIKAWSYKDTKGCFNFMKEIWNYQNYFNSEIDHEKMVEIYHISTIGWSGNEAIIYALQQNFMIWHTTWVQSRRGGHYIFERKIVDIQAESV